MFASCEQDAGSFPDAFSKGHFGEAIHRFTGPVGLIVLACVILGICISWWVVKRQEKRMEEKVLAEEDQKRSWED